MKTAIYIEDGLVQLVITPDSEFEKNALSTFRSKPLSAEIKVGTFYRCQGGYVRYNVENTLENESLMITIKEGESDVKEEN